MEQIERLIRALQTVQVEQEDDELDVVVVDPRGEPWRISKVEWDDELVACAIVIEPV